MGLGSTLRGFVSDVDDVAGRLVVRAVEATGRLPLQLRTFDTLCPPDRWTVRGRVVAHLPLAEAEVDAPAWRNLRDVLRRATAVDVAGARAVLHLPDGATSDAVADSEGYVRWELPAPAGVEPDADGWVEMRVEVASPRGDGPPVADVARVQVPPPSAGFLLVSDLDDTVLETGLTRGLTALRTTLLTNARTRTPYEGVAPFYRALQAGTGDPGTSREDGRGGPNPVVYVSGSPWTLVDLLRQTLEVSGIPVGPMELEDWGMGEDSWFTPATGGHKLERIDAVLAAAPHLPVVLVGDSGQHDPETYAEVVERHPGRVLAVYLRDVTRGERARQVRRIARGLTAASRVPVVLSPRTGPAAAHALELGLVDREAVADLLPGPDESGWRSTGR